VSLTYEWRGALPGGLDGTAPRSGLFFDPAGNLCGKMIVTFRRYVLRMNLKNDSTSGACTYVLVLGTAGGGRSVEVTRRVTEQA